MDKQTYKVVDGDTLWRIAKKFGVTIEHIKTVNDLMSNTIYPGQVLNIQFDSQVQKDTHQLIQQPNDLNKHPIKGKNEAEAAQMTAFVQAVNPTFNPTIAETFLKVSERYGVRGDIAFCQSIHETNWFKYGGDVKADQNNFAGIGATGGVQGNFFSTIEEGVTAQIQHLFAYASKEPLPKNEVLIDPRFELVKRGSAPYWEDLAGKWAYPGYNRNKYFSLDEAFNAGETYGQRIVILFKKMLQVEVENPPKQAPPSPIRHFKQYTINEFQKMIDSMHVKRKINHVQIHHTKKLKKKDYQGEETIYKMWKYHTKTRKWRDIGQHFTVAPDGTIWDGRSLELTPVGISGRNSGGIMIEMIGDFDTGKEQLEGEQLETVLLLVREFIKKFNLNLNSIVFHREYSFRTCPGTAISKEWFLSQVSNYQFFHQSITENDYPPNTPDWKKIEIDWLYEEGLLTDSMWKKDVNQPVPFWVVGMMLKRFYNKNS